MDNTGKEIMENLDELVVLKEEIRTAAKEKLLKMYMQLEAKNNRLKDALRIYSRPANYELSGIKPPCCDVLVRIAIKILEAEFGESAFEEDKISDKEYAKQLEKRIEELELEKEIEKEAAQKLCQIYFEIAEEFISEDEIRRRREQALEGRNDG